MRTAHEYGAEFAGFVQGFVKGWGLMEHPLGDDPDHKVMLTAATAAWEDHLIRVRRDESRAPRDGPRP